MAKAKGKPKANNYARNAKKKNILGHMAKGLPTEGNVKNTAIETGKDLVICIVGGGLIGAAIGKPSLLIGLGVTGMGHYTGSHFATLLGLGMMAANGFQSAKPVSGLDGFDMASVKDRMLTYKNNFTGKLYLDKIMPKKTEDKETTGGFGELQFFSYPNDMNGSNDELNGELSALERIERQIEESGMAHMQMTGTEGFGEAGAMGITDIADLNL